MLNKFKIDINGAEKNVLAEIVDKKIWFKIDERIFSMDLLELSSSQYGKSKSSSNSSDRIQAPMPGKVTKIFVSENQKVNKGDTLIVMEAMKMEYTLKSDIEASVEKITVKIGDQVTLGQLLIQLKEKG